MFNPLTVPSANAVGLIFPPQIEQVQPVSQKVSEFKIASKINPKLDRIKLIEQPSQRFRTNRPKSLNLLNEFILETRGGNIEEVIGLIAVYLFFLWWDQMTAVEGLQPNLLPLPHLQWIYKHNYKPGQFGSGKGGGSKENVVITEATRNTNSDKKQPSAGSWDYKNVMRDLNRQSGKRTVDVQVGDQIYSLRNPHRDGPNELSSQLAEKIYDLIRQSDTDICNIAGNLGFKADNIKNVKDHVFYSDHDLDRYGEVERGRFQANLQQALAWKRLENGFHTQDDVTWVKHECAERHHELKYGSGYSEAHNRAQSLFDGAPWDNQF